MSINLNDFKVVNIYKYLTGMIHMYRKLFMCNYPLNGVSQVVLVIKTLPANAGNIRDMGS